MARLQDFHLQDFRAGKPGSYPDQSIYAEFACAALGLGFEGIDGRSGLLFIVSSATKSVAFGGGRCSFYPQNNATAATLANDKYLANTLLERTGVATLGGRYFFLHQRHRALRATGHERRDAPAYLAELGGSGFAKPLLGSRGDFAQPIAGETMLLSYLDEVSRYYDSILLQPLASGLEYRVFVIDDAVLYGARKFPPVLRGDGVRSIAELAAERDAALRGHGISSATIDPAARDAVPGDGERREIPGRQNRSAGGTMVLEDPGEAAATIARQAVRALGLRVGAVDLFTEAGAPRPIRVIEVNSNPSIRFLEQIDRADLILAIWRHAFTAMGLL
jgi:hypothetical protein